MTDFIETKKSPEVKIQTLENRTNTDPIKLLPELSKVKVSNKQSQEIKIPYHHPNYKSDYDQQQGEKEHKPMSYDFRKE